MRYAALGTVFLVACSFEPGDGQFLCEESPSCPDGLTCVAGRCVRGLDSGLPDVGSDTSSDTGVDSTVVDASADTMMDAATPCGADFCADFDDVSSVDEGWTIAEVMGTGLPTLVEERTAPSAPHVFQSEVSTPPSGDTARFHAARLSLQQIIPSHAEATPTLELSFQFRLVDIASDNNGVTIAALVYGVESDSADSNVVLAVRLDGGSPKVVYYFSADGIIHDLGPIVMGEWNQVRVTVPPRVSVGGAPVTSGVTFHLNALTTTGDAPETLLSSNRRFDVGLATTSSSAMLAQAQYDDVRILYLDPSP